MYTTKNNIIIIISSICLLILLTLFIKYFIYNTDKNKSNNFNSLQPNIPHQQNHNDPHQQNHNDQHQPNHNDQHQPNHNDPHQQNHIVSHQPNHIDPHQPNKIVSHQPNKIVSHQPNKIVSHQPNKIVSHQPNKIVSHQVNKIKHIEKFDNTTNNYKAGLEFRILEGYHNENINFGNIAAPKGGLNATTGISTIIDSLSTGTSKIIKGSQWGGEGVEVHQFTVQWDGFFYTGNNPKGDWTFWTQSDDGSYLWLNSILIVNNGNPHGMEERNNNTNDRDAPPTTITLNTNQYYPIKIIFGEADGGFDMRVSFQGPNVSRRTDGTGFYFSMSSSYDPVAGLVQFNNLIATKVPWGIYSAESYDSNTNKLIEIRGTGKDATVTGCTLGSASGNGASANIKYLAGTTASTISWPVGSIPSNFTICSLTRYSGSTNRRILRAAPNTNWLHGHWNGQRGSVYYNGWIANTNKGTTGDWLITCGTNGANIASPDNILINVESGSGTTPAVATSIGSANSGTSNNDYLNINNTAGQYSGETSDFQFSQVIIWDQVLTKDEMKLVFNQFASYLTNSLYMYKDIVKLPVVQNNVVKLIQYIPKVPNGKFDGNYWIKTSGMNKQYIFYINNSIDGGGWILAYQTDVSNRINNAIPYSVNQKINLGSTVPSRIAYYMENDGMNAWVAFDMWPISAQASTSYDVPTGDSASNVFVNKVIVTNLTVISNSPNVTNITGGLGALEIWPSNYIPGKSAYDNNPSNLVFGSDGIYDSNDSGFDKGIGYGSFQVHNITDVNKVQTVFAWNRHGETKQDIGFGNNTGNGHTDWTFMANGATNFKFQVYIQESNPTVFTSIKQN